MKTLIQNPVVGSDPEVFAFAGHLNMIVPSFDLVGGTKEEPLNLGKEGFFIQEDNVLVEYNIPPSNTKEAFVANVHTGLNLVSGKLPDGFVPLVKSSHRFPQNMMKDPRAFIMGCEPDFNVYLEDFNPRPDMKDDPFLRSAGGHLHIGYDDSNDKINNLLVRYLDAYLGVPSVILDPDTDRRKLYGKAGACRHKKYGVEYRTLSSFWLTSSDITGWVWDQIMLAIDKANDKEDNIIKHEAFVIDTINNGNLSSAIQFVKENKIMLP